MLSVAVTGIAGSKERVVEPEMHPNANPLIQNNLLTRQKVSADFILQMQQHDVHSPLIPGLPDDVAKFCLALVPRRNFPAMGGVCKTWRSFIQSKELLTLRKEIGKLEEWMFILTSHVERKESQWEVWGGSGEKLEVLPPMPGPMKAGFGVAVLDAKFVIVGGYVVGEGTKAASNDVYEYDSRLNRWNLLSNMNVARHDLACAEVNGLIYVVGGLGSDGESLSSVEVYDPETDRWTLIEKLPRPRWGCFACSFNGSLFVMGGRSSFTIGNSRFIDVYSLDRRSWYEMRNGCVMVTAYAKLGTKLFCMEWKDQRKLTIFDTVDKSWHKTSVPVSGSSAVGFCLGVFGNKLLLFSANEVPGYQTLLYDPDAPVGSEWQTSPFKPSDSCLCSVTIKA